MARPVGYRVSSWPLRARRALWQGPALLVAVAWPEFVAQGLDVGGGLPGQGEGGLVLVDVEQLVDEDLPVDVGGVGALAGGKAVQAGQRGLRPGGGVRDRVRGRRRVVQAL